MRPRGPGNEDVSLVDLSTSFPGSSLGTRLVDLFAREQNCARQ